VDPHEITREILWNIPVWAKVLMYTSAAIATGIFVYGFYQRFKLWKLGQASPAEKTTAIRISRVIRHGIKQIRIHRSRMAGLSHHGIFWGFIVLFIGTVIVAIEDYAMILFGVEHFIFFGNFYLIVSFALEVFGIAFIGGLCLAIGRRHLDAKFKPLSRPVDFGIIWLFLLIAVTGFLTEGLRVAGANGGMEANAFEKWSFVGWGLGSLFSGMGESTLRGAHLTLWLVHMMASMAFIAAIPYCKLRHIFLSPASIALTNTRESGHYAGVSMEQVEETGKYGVAEVGDFTWRQLLSFDACTQCARCQTVCPAYATDKPLSPMQVVLDIAGAADGSKKLHGEAISADVLWACTSCGACVNECPVLIDQLGAIVDMRRSLVGEGEIRGSEQNAIRSISASGNPWGLAQNERLDWAKGLDVPTIEQEPEPEVLYWVGCAGSYDRRAQKTTQAMVKIFRAAGIKFAVLGQKERCTGDPARRMGDEFTYFELASENVKKLNALKFDKVVTACTHCFNTIKNEYPDLGGQYEVVHHTQFIQELIASGKLKVNAGANQKIAYHDACYLGRHNGEYDAPRESLKSAGATLTEPAQSREMGFCCGAGGGRMWMEEDIGTRINSERWGQLKVLQPEVVAVSCPFCMTMMTDAAAEEDSSIAVRDVAEIVAGQLDGASVG
jgi:Fe-S oxidoreductase/nitrate reductase gamma subunit